MRSIIDTELIYNEDKKLTTVKVLARIKIEDIEIKILPLLDSRCTSCLIHKKDSTSQFIN